MKKNLSILFLAFLLSLVAAACGANNNATSGSENASAEAKTTGNTEKMTIEHQLGKTDITKSPENVIVFDFGILDSLDKLGVNVLGVPQANIPPYLSKYEDATYENVGSLKEPDFEKIHSLDPELIIISGRQADSYEELSKIAPTIFMGVDTNNYLPSYKENMALLGEIFNKESEVAGELAKVEKSIEDLKSKASASGKKALIVLANEGNISAYGPGSRFGIIHDEFGLTPVDDGIEVSTHGQNVSFEYILEKNPDYLFVIDRGAAVEGESSAKALLDNDIINQINASKEDNIVYLDPNYWYLSGGGLISVSEMVKEIESSLE
ncbi:MULTISPECIES: siderophore ABC transporter substrate-binding protein [unclassified Sutcliffiella]|uniref:siderophore ABC transporter substrate-binding protein n=1 Tax=unclassified Sutcliffiella TaxID=2837532 RepID=UPI0030D3AEDB